MKTFGQLIRYGISGFTAFGLEFLTFALLAPVAPQLWMANSAAFFVGFWTSFLLNKFWSFRAAGEFWLQLGKYLILFAFNLGASNMMLYLMTDVGGLDKFVAKFVSAAAITAWNFVIFKRFIYKS